jgi:ParB family chromosome partitioning protein
MSTKAKNSKPQLGKGMAALLGAGAAPIGTKEKKEVSSKQLKEKISDKESRLSTESGPILVGTSQIKANKDQPRKIFKDKDLIELSASIKENGIIQPLIVSQDEDGKFNLIAGERRLRASKLAGLEMVPVVIKKVTKKETLVMAIIENVQRSDLNCVEESLAYYQLMNDFNLTQEEVAKKIGKERSTIANFLRILKLPREVLQYLQKEQLSFGHAKVLVAIKDDEKIKRLALEAIQENLSVRELEKLIKSKKVTKDKNSNPYFDERIDALRGKLEKKTGFHFDLKSKSNGSGIISIKFNNEAEFNDIYEYLMTK